MNVTVDILFCFCHVFSPELINTNFAHAIVARKLC